MEGEMLRKLALLTAALIFIVTTAQTSWAQGDEDGPRAERDIGDVQAAFQEEPVVYQITFPKIHGIVTPAFMLDAFFDDHANHWSQGQTNWAFGGEFIIRRIEQFDLVFGVDYADIRTTNDWWRQSGDPIIDMDWSINNLKLLTFDVAINWLAKITDFWDFYYGVGLGLGFIIGDFVKQDFDDEACLSDAGPNGQPVNPFTENDGNLVRDNCEDADGNPILDRTAELEEEGNVPPLIPAITLTLGSRWIIDEQWALQLEAGFKNIYFYLGLELGFIFGG